MRSKKNSYVAYYTLREDATVNRAHETRVAETHQGDKLRIAAKLECARYNKNKEYGLAVQPYLVRFQTVGRYPNTVVRTRQQGP